MFYAVSCFRHIALMILRPNAALPLYCTLVVVVNRHSQAPERSTTCVTSSSPYPYLRLHCLPSTAHMLILHPNAASRSPLHSFPLLAR